MAFLFFSYETYIYVYVIYIHVKSSYFVGANWGEGSYFAKWHFLSILEIIAFFTHAFFFFCQFAQWVDQNENCYFDSKGFSG